MKEIGWDWTKPCWTVCIHLLQPNAQSALPSQTRSWKHMISWTTYQWQFIVASSPPSIFFQFHPPSVGPTGIFMRSFLAPPTLLVLALFLMIHVSLHEKWKESAFSPPKIYVTWLERGNRVTQKSKKEKSEWVYTCTSSLAGFDL